MIHNTDCIEGMKQLPDGSINCCVTSPPYWGLRDYGHAGQIGLEDSPSAYVARMVEVFREVRRVLRDDGTLFLNLGDSYAGSGKGAWDNKDGGQKEVYIPDSDSPQTKIPKTPDGLKPKDLVGIPWRVAFALQEDGWYLRQDIIWHKPNPMPESCRDRCTKAHEYVFLMSKSPRYYWDREEMQVPAASCSAARRERADLRLKPGWSEAYHGNPPTGLARSGNKTRKDATGRGFPSSGVDGNVPWEGMTANRRSVWTITTKPFKGAHFATFPPDLIRPMVKTGCPPGGIVLDPFAGAGTTWLVALQEGRQFVGYEINHDYCKIARDRVQPLIDQIGWCFE